MSCLGHTLFCNLKKCFLTCLRIIEDYWKCDTTGRPDDIIYCIFKSL